MRERSFLRTPRGYVAASVACGVLAAVLTRAYVASASGARAAADAQVAVVVAGRPIARGAVVEPADLRVVRIPTAYAQPGSFSAMDRAAGRVALADLAPGEAATQTRLARVRAGPVASLVPEGLRAFAVPTSLPPGSVRAGDHVDILATYGGAQPHTESVVSGVDVLLVLGPSTAAGGSGGGGISLDASASGAASAVTLVVLVGPDQEERLAYARAFADLEVAIAPAG